MGEEQMNNKFWAVLFMGLLAGPMSANADLIDGLCDGTVDATVTCDPDTGLEWLSLTETIGLSVDDFRADVGGWQSGGWSLSTGDMVDQLFLNAGADSLDGIDNPANESAIRLLLASFGVTFDFAPIETAGYGNTAGQLRPVYAISFGTRWFIFGSSLTCCIDPGERNPNVGVYAYRQVPPAVLLERLETAVTGVGPGSSLAGKIDLAQTYLAVPDVQSTCAIMNAFENQVRAQRGKKLALELADKLTADAQVIKDAAGCD
jgi:hypothetical protein